MEKDGSKKLSTKTTVIVVAVVVVVAVLAIMNSYNGVQDSMGAATDAGNTAADIVGGNVSDTSSAQAPEAKSWHTVTTLSGNGIKTTAPFTIQGKQWRVNWKTTGKSSFQIFPARADKGVSSCVVLANIIGNGSDTSYCYEGGDFHLTVNTGNAWTVSVEDYY